MNVISLIKLEKAHTRLGLGYQARNFKPIHCQKINNFNLNSLTLSRQPETLRQRHSFGFCLRVKQLGTNPLNCIIFGVEVDYSQTTQTSQPCCQSGDLQRRSAAVVMIQGHTACLRKAAASLTNPLSAAISLFLHCLMTKEVVTDVGSLISVLTMSLSVALVKFFCTSLSPNR